MTIPLASPFGDDPIEEVPLSRPPLLKVIAQVQFPRLTALQGSPESAISYAKKMAPEYPILNEASSLQMLVTPEGGVQQQSGGAKVWQMQSGDGSWQITLSDTSLALETVAYSNRVDFCQRLEMMLGAFTDTVGIPFVQRLGVRYVNRLDDPDDLHSLTGLFRSAVNAVHSEALPAQVSIEQSLTQSFYKIDIDDGLLARWGLLPPNVVVDPSIPPATGPSFVLDLDAFREYPGRAKAATKVIAADASMLSARAYRYFRWAVTDEFLENFGGEL